MNREKQIKVLQIMNGAVAGGISTVILNYYSRIERDKVHFDCAMPDVELGVNGFALKELGCEIIQLPLKSREPINYWRKLHKILKDGKYDAIHVNGNATSFYALLVAKCAGIPVRIAHAHTAMKSTSQSDKVRRLLSHLFTEMLATKILACTEDSAKIIFGRRILESKKFMILRNSIDVEKFRFNENVRQSVRKAYNLENKFVVGCVGNLGVEKNHAFALKVLNDMRHINNNVCLLLVGDGVLRAELEEKAKELGIDDKVAFLGRRTDINELLQAMDVFLMPSLYEGLSLAAMEAAASGLPICFSDTIYDNFSFYNNRQFISLNCDTKIWAQKILERGVEPNRSLGAQIVKKAGFDLEENARIFQSLYGE